MKPSVFYPRLFSILWSLCFIYSPDAHAIEKRDLLQKSTSLQQLRSLLDSGTNWIPFHPYQDRDWWEKMDASHRMQFIKQGEAQLNYTWKTVTASSYLAYVRSGNRQVMEKINTANTGALKKLIVAELMEGKGRFTDAIMDGVWMICEMTSWASPAHLYIQQEGLGLPNVQEPIIDLSTGTTACLLAWTHYFFQSSFDKINPLIAQRIRVEINRRILTPYYTRNDFWWMTLGTNDFANNWNVWINYNVLNCILLLETDAEKRSIGVYKTMRSVDKFINYYKNDGACEEGPSYWSLAGGMLFQYLDLLSNVTHQQVSIFQHPLIGKIGQYICNAFISQPYYINFADANAKIQPDAGLIYRYGKATQNNNMMGFGSFLAKEENWKKQIPLGYMESTLQNLLIAKEISEYPAKQPVEKYFWMPETEIAAAREHHQPDSGFYFAAKGGHNQESHNHNDVGSFILYFQGKPLLIDIGAETYTKKTFSRERYTIWAMRSAYHNIPLINGVEQSVGAEFKSKDAQFNTEKGSSIFSVDIAGAYPDSAKVQQWVRTYTLKKSAGFEIKDQYALKENKGNTNLYFMTPCQPIITAPGEVQLNISGDLVNIHFDPAKSNFLVEKISITDERLQQNWGETIYRLSFQLKSSKLKGSHIITVNTTPTQKQLK